MMVSKESVTTIHSMKPEKKESDWEFINVSRLDIYIICIYYIHKLLFLKNSFLKNNFDFFENQDKLSLENEHQPLIKLKYI